MDFEFSHLYLENSDNIDILSQEKNFKLFITDKNNTL